MKQGLLFILLSYVYSVQGAPLVQSIANKTQIGYEVVSCSDQSRCSAQVNYRLIDSKTVLHNEFLLERGMPSLVLRPVYYVDRVTGSKISLVDEDKQFDEQLIDQAYEVWQKAGNKKRFKSAQDWFKRWVGQDIKIVPHTSEIVGYLINLSRVHIGNAVKEHGTWLSFAKGVFAKLVLEIDIAQHDRKGIIPTIKVVNGEGGICSNGIIERL